MLDDAALQKAVTILRERVEKPEDLVAFTGSGISSESGIPVFRGNEGLWKGFRPEDLATPDAFRRDPERVWEWYHWRKQLVLQAQPNAAHRALARLERRGILSSVVTQNVDGLHQRAGSEAVIELHGNLLRARCWRCGHRFPLAEDTAGIVHCPACGSTARPDVVWFGEMLPETAWNEAFRAMNRARVVLVVGTSGVVYPAASLCEMAAEKSGDDKADLIVINPQPSQLDDLASVRIPAGAAQALPRLVEALLKESPS